MSRDEQLTFETCGLCGEESTDTDAQLVEWTEEAMTAMKRPRYQKIDRCRDRVACRQRVEHVLEVRWPVNDRTPASATQPAAVQPVPPIEAPAAVVPEKVVPWLA